MPKIRVLAVDDAVVVRRMVSDALDAEPDIEVVGVAANGRIALQKITQLAPDIITLDVEMPELDGIATVREIRKQWPDLPVIMFSTLTERGATATFDALAAGATDYCTKPANVGSVTAAQERIRQHLAPKLRLLTERARQRGGRTVAARSHGTPAAPPRPVVVKPPVRPASTSAVVGLPHVLAIGTSTGGPNALASLLPALPSDLPVPVVIVQHMPPLFTKLLADRLHQQCPFPVHEATNGQIVEAGHVYLAPGDFHMETVRRGADIVIRLSQAPPENSCRPAVDVLFRSVVDVYGGHVLGVILTGMGQDGLVGSRHIVEAGGRVLAQDEASSVVWGMPGFVVHAGLASAVVPLAGMARTMAGLLGPRHDARPLTSAINGKSHVALNH